MIARSTGVLLRVDDLGLSKCVFIGLGVADAMVLECKSDASLFREAESGKRQILVSQFNQDDPADVCRVKMVTELYPRLSIVLVQASPQAALPLQSVRNGVSGFVPAPVDIDAVAKALLEAVCPEPESQTRVAAAAPYLIGNGQAMQQVKNGIDWVVDTSHPVLIQGEPGTGKRLAAFAIHDRSHRRDKSVHVIHCGDFAIESLDRLLFGPRPIDDTPGMLNDPRIGTIVLHELAALSPVLQARLIEWIRHRKLADNYPALVITTARDLGRLVADHKVRADLFLELSNRLIGLPPLRHRRGDIPLLVEYFSKHINDYLSGLSKTTLALDGAQLEKLIGHSWVHNVRQLRSVLVEFALIYDESQSVLANRKDGDEDLFDEALNASSRRFAEPIFEEIHQGESALPEGAAKPTVTLELAPTSEPFESIPSADRSVTQEQLRTSEESLSGDYWGVLVERLVADGTSNIYARALAAFEKRLFQEVLERTGGNLGDSARLLGVTGAVLRKKMQQLEIPMPVED